MLWGNILLLTDIEFLKKNSSDFKVLNEKQTFSAEPNQNTLEGLCFKTKYMYTKHQITEYPCHIIISCHISDKVSHALNVNTFSESYFFSLLLQTQQSALKYEIWIIGNYIFGGFSGVVKPHFILSMKQFQYKRNSYHSSGFSGISWHSGVSLNSRIFKNYMHALQNMF